MPPKFVKFAHALDGSERGEHLKQPALLRVLAAETPAWVHLDGKAKGTAEWIAQHLDYLDPQAIEALLEVDTRPRVSVLGKGMIVILRALNANEGKDPEDMISVRMWIDSHRIITISRSPARAIARMDEKMRQPEGPRSAGAFLVAMVEDITEEIAQFQQNLDGKAEDLEESVVAERGDHLGRDVVDLRLTVIATRRFLLPQMAALGVIAKADLDFIDQTTRREIEEEYLKLTRVVEDLEELREQTMVLREELSVQLSDRLNHNMFFLSIISAIFLPLGFLTGLFGVNVGGLPGTGNSDAFLWLCLAMLVLALVLVLFLWRLRWIGRRKN